MRIIVIGLATLVAGLAADVAPSFAQGKQAPRPWCIQPSLFDRSGMINCSFYSLEQCQASLGGVRGSCIPNPEIEWARRQKQQQRRQDRDWQWR